MQKSLNLRKRSFCYADDIHCIWGFIFKFYSDDHEPVHVHVIKDRNEAKYNVDPDVVQVFNHGFKKHEISMIESIIEENVDIIKNRWTEYFNSVR